MCRTPTEATLRRLGDARLHDREVDLGARYAVQVVGEDVQHDVADHLDGLGFTDARLTQLR